MVFHNYSEFLCICCFSPLLVVLTCFHFLWSANTMPVISRIAFASYSSILSVVMVGDWGVEFKGGDYN